MAKRKRLPRGNLAENTRGNLKPGLRGVDGPPSRRVLAFQGSKRGQGTGYNLPVNHHVKEPYRYNVRPGFEEAALPLEGPPGSEWWHSYPYNGRRR
jgi:hypothetical protein